MPAQTGLAEGATEMLTGKSGFTVMVTVLEAAGLPIAQIAVEVNMEVMVLLFAGVKV